MSTSHTTCNLRLAPLAVSLALAVSGIKIATADSVSGRNIAPLKDGVPAVFVVHKGRSVKIERDIDRAYQLQPGMRSTLSINDRNCPPFCMQPMQLDVPVATVSELEIIDFMLTTLRDNKGVLVDVRGQREYDKGTIPGSESHPVRKFQDAKTVEQMMEDFGATRRNEVGRITRLLEDWGINDTRELTPEWDFSRAKELLIWSNGPTCKLAPDVIRTLVAAGYPPHKLHWYRAGMPGWQFWGLNTIRKPKKY